MIKTSCLKNSLKIFIFNMIKMPDNISGYLIYSTLISVLIIIYFTAI